MLCSGVSFNTIMQGRMVLAMHVALMDRIKNTISGLVGKYEEEEVLLDDLYIDQTIILKWMLNRVQ